MTTKTPSTTPMLGCIADDYTGATDLSSMLVRAGRRVIQHFGLNTDANLEATTRESIVDADAVVIALKSRSVAAASAVRESRAALKLLQSYGASRFFFKYCSTFDSTPDGNIGPVAEALADALDVDDVWYCPSFPENGRTVYCGHLFVHGVLLAESGMREHPLNPMTDSNLVRVLQAQSTDRVGLLPLAELRGESPPAPVSAGVRHRIVDAIANDDLERVAQLAADRRLLTGGSAVAGYWATTLFGDRDATFPPPTDHLAERQIAAETDESADAGIAPAELPATIVLAGSCSPATREQISDFAQHGPVLPLTVADAASDVRSIDRITDRITDRVIEWLREQAGRPAALVTSGWDPDAVRAAVHAVGERRAACLTEALFATIARKLVEHGGVRRLIVAGGETSGAVINALNIRVVRIGREIAPGVPWIHTLHGPRLSLALKSGNFGGATFFRDAVGTFDTEPGDGGAAP